MMTLRVSLRTKIGMKSIWEILTILSVLVLDPSTVFIMQFHSIIFILFFFFKIKRKHSVFLQRISRKHSIWNDLVKTKLIFQFHPLTKVLVFRMTSVLLTSCYPWNRPSICISVSFNLRLLSISFLKTELFF